MELIAGLVIFGVLSPYLAKNFSTSLNLVQHVYANHIFSQKSAFIDSFIRRTILALKPGTVRLLDDGRCMAFSLFDSLRLESGDPVFDNVSGIKNRNIYIFEDQNLSDIHISQYQYRICASNNSLWEVQERISGKTLLNTDVKPNIDHRLRIIEGVSARDFHFEWAAGGAHFTVLVVRYTLTYGNNRKLFNNRYVISL